MTDEMVISRELVRQALDQLTINRTNFRRAPSKSICKMLAGGNDEVIQGLRGALAVPPRPVQEPDTCTWQQDGDSDSGAYGTSCGRYFNLEDGTPEDNRLAWCCYCGKKLVQELIVEDRDG